VVAREEHRELESRARRTVGWAEDREVEDRKPRAVEHAAWWLWKSIVNSNAEHAALTPGQNVVQL
jgi:hypothetical protein